ncbi:MAG TPA: GH116 family glycosyl-hydrolase [Planctomycetota bacterium]|jgi:uncharacterized protein (DUF608 family)|nr:GH116 family glycosyl-hydrolase [Planctomycetota bacterium]
MRRRPPRVLLLFPALLLLGASPPLRAGGEGPGRPDGRRYESGVPLGGIGAGKLEIFDDGSLGRATFNHNGDDPLPLEGSLFAIRVERGGPAVVRALRSTPVLGFEPVPGIGYEGLFPRARLDYEGLPVEARLEAFSPLIPGDAASSGTPAAIFLFRIRNPADAPARVSLLAAVENLLGCGGPRRKRLRDRTGNFVDGVARQGFAGVRLVTDRTVGDDRRNHLGEYALLVQGPEGGAVSIRAYDAAGSGADLREDFAADGRIDGETSLRGLEGKVHPGGAVCASFEVPPRTVRECAFAFAWHLPHFVTADGRDHPPAYTLLYASAADVAAAALRRRGEWLAATREWQDLLLDSTLPAWLVRKLCNDACTLFANTVWTADGAFATLESPEDGGGALGAMEERLCAHALSFSFFPALERAELRLFAGGQRPDGEIPRSCGNIHDGFGAAGGDEGVAPRPDRTCAFVLQVEKAYRWTGDRSFLEEMLPHVRRALEWLATRDRDGDGIPEGGSGAGRPPGTSAYEASVYLATLRAGEWIGRTVGDSALEKSCASRFEEARRSMVGELWNGRWFSKAFDPATGERSDACSVDQLAGEWFASLLDWDPLVPEPLLDRAVDSMLRLNGRVSPHLPPTDVEPDGGWGESPDARLAHAETYLASLAIARGRANEGIEILHAIDRTVRGTASGPWDVPLEFDARSGRPKRGRSHMASPASWFALYALAGFALDLPDGAIRLRPNLPDGRTTARIPLFAPNFVARLETEAPGASAGRRMRFEILRRFPGEPLRVERIETDLPPFAGGAEPSVRVLLDGHPEEAAQRRSGSRLVLRLARPAILEPGTILEVHVAPPAGTIEIDAASGALRHVGTPLLVDRIERGERTLRFSLRNPSTVDHTVRLRIRGWSGETASLRPLLGVATREDLEGGVPVTLPGRLFSGAEVARLRRMAGRIEEAPSAAGGELGPEGRALLSAVPSWKDALAAADATGRLDFLLEPAAAPSAEPAAGDRAAGSSAPLEPDGRASLRAEVRGPVDRAIPRARAALAGASEGSSDRTLLEALNDVGVELLPAHSIEPGQTLPLEIVLRNDSERRASGWFSLAAPPGFRMDPPGSVEVEDLQPGEALLLPFVLGAPEEASPLHRYALEWRARLRVGDVETLRSGHFAVGRAFLTRWRAVGPFENPEDAGLSLPLKPEAELDLSSRYRGRGGEVGWKPARAREGFVDLEDTLGRTNRAVAYAVCWVLSPSARNALLEFGSGDGAKVWFDDDLVFEKHDHGEAAPSQERIPVRLKEGWTRLLVKAEQAEGDWGFYFELAGPEGEGLDDLGFRDEPPSGG